MPLLFVSTAGKVSILQYVLRNMQILCVSDMQYILRILNHRWASVKFREKKSSDLYFYGFASQVYIALYVQIRWARLKHGGGGGGDPGEQEQPGEEGE